MTIVRRLRWPVIALVVGCVVLAIFDFFFKKSRMSDWAIALNQLQEINLKLFEEAVERGGIFKGFENRVCVVSAMVGGEKIYYIYFPGKCVAQHGEGQVIGGSLLSYEDHGRMVRAAMLSDGSGKLIGDSEFLDVLKREVDGGNDAQNNSRQSQ